MHPQKLINVAKLPAPIAHLRPRRDNCLPQPQRHVACRQLRSAPQLLARLTHLALPRQRPSQANPAESNIPSEPLIQVAQRSASHAARLTNCTQIQQAFSLASKKLAMPIEVKKTSRRVVRAMALR